MPDRRRAAALVAVVTAVPLLLTWPSASSSASVSADAAPPAPTPASAILGAAAGTGSGTGSQATADPTTTAPAAGTSGAGPTDPTTTVSVQLSAPDPTRLAAVAGRPLHDRATRLDRLADLVPDAQQHAEVAADLVARGFTLGTQTAWSIQATGPTALVARTFDTGTANGTANGAATTGATAGATVPASLTDDVDAVLPVQAPALAHPLATGTLTGSDVRNADTPATVNPSGGDDDASLTVATLQFATWNTSDLTTYAGSAGLPDPVASGQYRAVTVDRGATSSSGAEEVALDQESLLSVAPTARQAAYFAPNTAAGFLDSIAQVYDDVVENSHAVSPDAHIAALSISWGACETSWSRYATQMQNELAALTAAGVTVFAASGDQGIYDCHSSQSTGYSADVDFPASAPAVVAVGATRLSASTSAPNTGLNWTEKAWTCSSRTTCTASSADGGTGGSGGGASGSGGVFAGFARPSWQTAALAGSAYAGGSTRLVPDIAADGDPDTGFRLRSGGTWYDAVGGTSLATPLSAGQLVDLLGDAGRTTGVGDIHAALYRAYTATSGLAVTDPARVFRDVTVGRNGATTDAGADPSVVAGAGYDTVSGLGGVLWAALAPYLDLSVAKAPAVSTSGAATTSSGAGTASDTLTVTARLHRHGSRATARWTTSAVGGTVTRVRVRVVSAGHTVFAAHAGAGSKHLRVRPGRVYVLEVIGHDSAGRVVRRTARLRVPTARRSRP